MEKDRVHRGGQGHFIEGPEDSGDGLNFNPVAMGSWSMVFFSGLQNYTNVIITYIIIIYT